ncbi:MAG: hydrogenase maturation nickel metallochaperone HypA [Bryobacterales bacterium]|nr:hydrogenase maturation nickel metallochaperone HypA [Bryobacterales bacterium]
MHETSLIPDLMAKIEAVARENGARKITAVDVEIGALAMIGPDHLREHFIEAAVGTIAEGAELRLVVAEDPLAPEASSLLLKAVEVET